VPSANSASSFYVRRKWHKFAIRITKREDIYRLEYLMAERGHIDINTGSAGEQIENKSNKSNLGKMSQTTHK